MSGNNSRSNYAPWSIPRVFQSDVDLELLHLVAQAEEDEHNMLSALDFSPESFSPYEFGGVTPTSSICPTPATAPDSIYTEDVLNGASQVLAGKKRVECEDEHQQSRTEFRKEAKRRRKNAKKNAKAAGRDLLDENTQDVRSKVAKKYDHPLKIRVADVQAAISIARSSDVGHNRPAETALYDLKACIAKGWKHVEIDAELPIPVVITDNTGYAIVKMIPGPECKDWEETISEAADICEEGRCEDARAFADAEQCHRRGNFAYVSAGPTHGNGRLEPGNLKQTHPELTKKLFRSRPFRRMAGHQDACFRHYDPKLYEYCKSHVVRLHDHHPNLKRNFRNSIYTSATVNLGPCSCCFGHCDCHNSVKVRCAVTSMGPFNYKLGGHMVLEDFKIILDFPPGWTCLIPSASVRHGNTPIQPGERRYSFTQYISGNLFRWVRHKFRLASSLDPEEKAQLDGTSESRLRETLSLFTLHGQYARDRGIAKDMYR